MFAVLVALDIRMSGRLALHPAADGGRVRASQPPTHDGRGIVKSDAELGVDARGLPADDEAPSCPTGSAFVDELEHRIGGGEPHERIGPVDRDKDAVTLAVACDLEHYVMRALHGLESRHDGIDRLSSEGPHGSATLHAHGGLRRFHGPIVRLATLVLMPVGTETTEFGITNAAATFVVPRLQWGLLPVRELLGRFCLLCPTPAAICRPVATVDHMGSRGDASTHECPEDPAAQQQDHQEDDDASRHRATSAPLRTRTRSAFASPWCGHDERERIATARVSL
jgi:hypothetical protein